MKDPLLSFGVKWKVREWSQSCWRGMCISLAFALSFHACFSPDAALALLALAELWIQIARADWRLENSNWLLSLISIFQTSNYFSLSLSLKTQRFGSELLTLTRPIPYVKTRIKFTMISPLCIAILFLLFPIFHKKYDLI